MTCIQISQEAGKVVWYSHLLNFPQFVVIHTVKGFGIVKTTTILVGVKYLMVLVCASRVTDDIEHLFICLLVAVAFEEMSVHVFCPALNCLFVIEL